MKSALSLITLVAVVLVVVPPTQAGSDNLVRNGSFEYGLGPMPEGWLQESLTGGIVRHEAEARHGAYSALVVGVPEDGYAAGRSDAFAVSPGQEILLTASVRDSATPVEIGLAFSDGTERTVGDRVRSEAWTTVSLRTTVPAGAYAASVVILLRGETVSSVDNVVVRPIPVGATGYREDFDTLSAWTVEGVGASVACDGAGAPGCWLSLDPSVPDAYLTGTANVNVPVTDVTTISMRFRGGTLDGDTDTEFEFRYDDNAWLLLRTTDGVGFGNNGVSFDTPYGQTGAFTWWESVDTWHTAVITLDPIAETAQVAVYDDAGQLVGGSEPLATGPITQLATAKFIAAMWGSDAPAYGWDTLVIE